MPTLPSITVTQEQADRILAAYSTKYETTTQAETVAAYRRELTAYVVSTVVETEGQRLLAEQEAARAAAMEEILDGLPGTPPPAVTLPPPEATLPTAPPPEPPIEDTPTPAPETAPTN